MLTVYLSSFIFGIILILASLVLGEKEADLDSDADVDLSLDMDADADVDLIFETPATDLWAAVLRRIGIEPGSLVPGAGVH